MHYLALHHLLIASNFEVSASKCTYRFELSICRSAFLEDGDFLQELIVTATHKKWEVKNVENIGSLSVH